ncbi:hypothetical protein [Faecalispora jeddahensis]|uniref:hypothetical protein n=1 Tax=Faecalispora jeddahensis TaxID=1414721 RepID=UPI001897BD60|nr:hypothetical protein [Faecalispora jeddahensis]
MPDITTLFEGTDGVSRTLFNQKLSDVNAHGNSTTMHVTAAERAAWNGKATTTTYTTTLSTTWTGTAAPYTQTVTVTGILATDNPVISPVLSSTLATAIAQLEAWGYVGRITTAANSITAYCYDTKPTTAIPFQLKVVR